MPSAWVKHVQSVYQAGKAKGMSYKQAMVAAKKTYKRGGKKAEASADDEKQEAKPKGRRRKKKSSVSKPSANFPVEVGAPEPKARKRVRKRPMPPKGFKNIN